MKTIRFFILTAFILGLIAPVKAFAGSETRCYAYGNANALVYCLNALQGRGIIRTEGMEPGTARVYQTVATQQLVPPTVIPGGNVYYATYKPNPVSVIGNVAGSILNATAWAYNWRHGYVGARGVWGAAYMMNYPW